MKGVGSSELFKWIVVIAFLAAMMAIIIFYFVPLFTGQIEGVGSFFK